MSRASVKAYQHLASLLEAAGQSEPPPKPGGNGANTPPESFPAVWATSWGEDEFGFWCGVEIKHVEQRFRWIPPGTANIGSSESEPGRFDDEHSNQFTVDGFWLAETTCTQELWHAVTGDNPAKFSSLDQPVEQVSWDDIHQQLLPNLAELSEGLALRLPTEVEWEYACRAGSETPFWWGDVLTTDLANFDGEYPYAESPEGEHRKKTVDAFHFFPNPWGLYQMHGNVWEWCSDLWRENPSVISASPEAGQNRVIRGGSWSLDGRILRSAVRSHLPAGNRGNGIGFRLVAGPHKHR